MKVGKVIAIHRNNSATGGHLELENGETVPFSYLILATGSRWEGPVSPLNNNKISLKDSLEGWRAKFDKAQDIVLVGAGAIGLGQLFSLTYCLCV